MTENQAQLTNIRILITDDHAIVREGLRTLIKTEPGLEVIGEASDGFEAVQMAYDLKPDVILMDMQMPRMGGLEAINKIKEDCPDARILVLTSFSDDDTVFPAIKAGALGYLLKNTHPDRLLNSIRDVHLGKPTMSSDIATKLMIELQRRSDLPPTKEPLTNREMDVLKLAAKGMSNQDIADELCLSLRTIQAHLGHVFNKMQVSSRTEAVVSALKEGWITLEDIP